MLPLDVFMESSAMNEGHSDELRAVVAAGARRHH